MAAPQFGKPRKPSDCCGGGDSCNLHFFTITHFYFLYIYDNPFSDDQRDFREKDEEEGLEEWRMRERKLQKKVSNGTLKKGCEVCEL